MSRKLNEEAFKKKAMEKHDCKYSYENVVFVDAHTKVKIECPIHGIFEETPAGHIYAFGYGCRKCESPE